MAARPGSSRRRPPIGSLKFPSEPEETVIVDGADVIRIFFPVAMPLAHSPLIAAVTLLCIPSVALFLPLHHHFIRGVAVGSEA
jgi:ABC-type glycerol-3-phosphate transport system permease component